MGTNSRLKIKMKTEDKKEKETKQEEDSVRLAEIVSETKAGYRLPNGEVVALEVFLAWIGEQVYQIRKSVE